MLCSILYLYIAHDNTTSELLRNDRSRTYSDVKHLFIEKLYFLKASLSCVVVCMSCGVNEYIDYKCIDSVLKEYNVCFSP